MMPHLFKDGNGYPNFVKIDAINYGNKTILIIGIYSTLKCKIIEDKRILENDKENRRL